MGWLYLPDSKGGLGSPYHQSATRSHPSSENLALAGKVPSGVVWSEQGRTPSACPRHFPSINAAEDAISVLGSGTHC